MVPILLSYAVWIPPILGFGMPFLAVRRRLAPAGDPSAPLLLFIAGLAVLGTLVNLLNFVIAVGPLVALLLLLAGWALFLARAREIGQLLTSAWPHSPLSLGLLALLVLTWTAYVARLSPLPYDTGLYHLQAIKWITESQLPPGLANVHSRFGFNSIWFSVSAALEVPFLAGKGIFVMNGLLYSMFGLAAASSLGIIARGKISASGLFLGLSTFVWFLLARQETVGSPSTDLPTILLGLTSVYLLLRALEQGRDYVYYALSALVVAVLQIAIKLSGLVLVLTPLLILVVGRRSGQANSGPGRGATRMALAAAVAATLAVLVPWSVRSVALSGYIAYPLPFGRQDAVPWAVPLTVADNEQQWIMSWARKPGARPEQVLGNWDWVQPWFSTFTSDEVVRQAAALVALGALLWLFSGWRNLPPGRLAAYLVPLSVPMLGLAMWLFTAPDLRFGWAYIWPLSLLLLATGIARFRDAYPRLQFPAFLALAGLLIPFLILVSTVSSIQHFGALDRDELTGWPAIPLKERVARQTDGGFTVFSSEGSDQCWDQELPCAPNDSFKPEMVVITDEAGRPRQFQLP